MKVTMIKNNVIRLCVQLSLVFLFSTYIANSYTKLVNNNQTNRYAFQRPITIERAVYAAHKNREDLKSFDYSILASKYDQKAALAGILPQFSMTSNANRSGGLQVLTTAGLEPESPATTDSQTAFPRSLTIQLSQLIFSLDGPIDQYKITKMGTKIIESQKEQLINAIRFNTETSFYDLQKELLKNSLISALEDSSELTFDRDTASNKVGFLNRSGWLQAQATFEDNLSDITNYPNDIQIALSRLERQTNTDMDPFKVSLSMQDINRIKLKPLEYYYRKALLYRPELEEKDHRIKQAKYSELFFKKQYIPTVRVFADITKAWNPCENNLLDNIEVPTIADCLLANLNRNPVIWSVGVIATWSFDGLGSAHTGVAYEKHVTEFELQKRDLELQIVKNIKAVYYQLKNLFGQVRATEIQYKQSRVELDRKEQQKKVGEAAYYEVAQEKLNNKILEYALITLKIEINNLYANLLFLCGYPPELSNSYKVKYEQ